MTEDQIIRIKRLMAELLDRCQEIAAPSIKVSANLDTQRVLLNIEGVGEAQLTPRQAHELAQNLRKFARVAIGRPV